MEELRELDYKTYKRGDDPYMNLCGAIFEQAFVDVKSMTRRRTIANVKIIDRVVKIIREIVKSPYVDYVLTDPVGVCTKYMQEIAPISKGKNKYEITDKKTGVRFTAYLNYHYPDYYILKRRSDIDIIEVQPETCENCVNAVYDSAPYGSTSAEYLSGCEYEDKLTDEQAEKYYNGCNCCPYWEGLEYDEI